MYNYQEEKKDLLTEDGIKTLLKIRDRVKHLLNEAGAFRMEHAFKGASGSTWTMMACIDFMVEQGEISECKHSNINAGQNRIFTDKGWQP